MLHYIWCIKSYNAQENLKGNIQVTLISNVLLWGMAYSLIQIASEYLHLRH